MSPRRRRGIVSGTLKRNLVAFWNLEEASGTRVDATGRGNNLTDNNTVTSNPGIIGTAGQFTAANSEYLSIADNADLSLGSDTDFTIAVWAYFDSLTLTQTLIGKTNSAGGDAEEYLLRFVVTTDRLIMRMSNGLPGEVGTVTANTLGLPSTGRWYFVVGWHDSNANTVNIEVNNGGVDSSAWTGGTQNTTNPLEIGRLAGAGTQLFDGRMDAVGIWKRALTAAERRRLYNDGNGRQHPNL